MFCPKCNAYLTERDLIKTEVKYAPGNVPIEYRATCPHCRIIMGRVSWGQFTVDPELEEKLKTQDAEETDASQEEPAPEPAPEVHEKVCPHCGKPLPEGY